MELHFSTIKGDFECVFSGPLYEITSCQCIIENLQEFKTPLD